MRQERPREREREMRKTREEEWTAKTTRERERDRERERERETKREREQKHTPNDTTRHTTAEDRTLELGQELSSNRRSLTLKVKQLVGYDLPQISARGVRVGYGWGTGGVRVGSETRTPGSAPSPPPLLLARLH